MSAAAIHHPHFLRVVSGPRWGSSTFEFRAFTGAETDPLDWHSALTAQQRAAPALYDECLAARKLWEQAIFSQSLPAMLRPLEATWRGVAAELTNLTTTYSALDDTTDNHWRSQLLKLARARIAALDAAAAWDQAVVGWVRVCGRWSGSNAELVLLAAEWADITSWVVGDLEDYDNPYRDTPLIEQVNERIRHQDRELALLEKLTGDSGEIVRDTARSR
ncbi:hypothetical protein ACIGO9_29625 [Nocardia asteroides]|uniref:hypothetical protein n=1 Tax=Nocardia asteroides TaxID=1824 RepID=UPI0037C7A69A